MLTYALKRLLMALPIALAVSVVCFLLVHVAPGDPVSAMLPPQASPELIARMRQEFGLDRPLPVQYAHWLQQALTGNLGLSITTGRPVAAEVGNALSNTLAMASLAAAWAMPMGISLGMLAAYGAGSWVDRLATLLSIIGVSVPHYWLAMVLVVVFSVQLQWLPAVGAGGGQAAFWQWDQLRYMLLPAAAMAVVPLGIVARTVKALTAEVLARDFVQALRAKGLSEVAVLRHVARNIAPTALSVAGMQLGYLLGGSILIEAVFSWPGTGFLLNTAIFQRDIPLLQGTVLLLAMLFVGMNTAVDIVQAVIDPRIQRK